MQAIPNQNFWVFFWSFFGKYKTAPHNLKNRPKTGLNRAVTEKEGNAMNQSEPEAEHTRN